MFSKKIKILIYSILIAMIIITVLLFKLKNKEDEYIKKITVTSCTNNLEKILWYKKDSEYYLFLPSNVDRNNLIINFDKKNNNILVTKDNKIIDNNKKTDIFSNDKVILKAKYKNKKKNYVINVMTSSLPAVFIIIDGGDKAYEKIISDFNHKKNYTGSSLVIEENNEMTYDIEKIRGRGNSSWLKLKKPFQIKFYEKTPLLGMKSAKKWNLIANYWDGSLSRNYLWLDLAKRMNLDYNVEFKPADIYINNKYQGSYLVTSKVEVAVNRLDLKHDEYLLEITNRTLQYDIISSRGYKMNIKNPDLDKLSNSNKNKVKEDVKKYLKKIEDLIYDEENNFDELVKYIDIESFVKYFWIQEFSENYDAIRGSNYMYVKNGKLYMGPVWDMDNTLNRSYLYSDVFEEYILTNEKFNERIMTNWYKKLMQKEEFKKIVDEYFINNVELFEDLLINLDEYKNKIELSANMNYVRWPYDEMKSTQKRHWILNETSYDDAYNNLKDALIERLKWYKSKYSIN